MTATRVATVATVLAVGVSATAASPAAARPLGASSASELNVPKAACGVAGVLNKAVGIACGVLSNGGALIKSGKQLATGHVGGAVSTLLGGGAGTVASTASTALGLAAIGTWVVGGAGAVLHAATAALGATTTPQLHTTWFSATYWRMAEIAALLTLPFLFAATVQAALRSDLALLTRAAFGYLPLAMLSIAIAAPVTTLLLAASDELCGLISSAASNAAAHLLDRVALIAGGLTIIARSPFLAFLIGLLMIGAAFMLWIELLLREAAVYVVVLMLPLAFAALAWPARRIWAVRAVELLIALILSKFAIVAVLSLGGAAVGASVGHGSITGAMAGTVLIMLATMSPWVLLRLVPLAEIASGAAGGLRGEVRSTASRANAAVGYAQSGADWAGVTTATMKRDADVRMADGNDPPPRGGGSDPGGRGDDPPRPGGGSDPGGRGDDPPRPVGGSDLGGRGDEPPDPAGGGPPDGAGPPDGGGPRDEGGPPHGDGPPHGGGPPHGDGPLDGGGSPHGGGPRDGGASRRTSDAPSPPPPDPPPSSEVPWKDLPELELGPNFAETPVWPHEDAE